MIDKQWIHNMEAACKNRNVNKPIHPKQPILKGLSNSVAIFSVYGTFIGLIL